MDLRYAVKRVRSGLHLVMSAHRHHEEAIEIQSQSLHNSTDPEVAVFEREGITGA